MKRRFLSLFDQPKSQKIQFIALCLSVPLSALLATSNCSAQSSANNGGAFGGSPIVTKPSRIQQDGKKEFSLNPPLKPAANTKAFPPAFKNGNKKPLSSNQQFARPASGNKSMGKAAPLRPTQDGSTSNAPLPPKKAQNQKVSSASTARVVNLDTCFVKIIEDIEIPAEESGKLTSVIVKPGDYVTRNQLIAQMDDQRSRRMLEEATFRQQSANRLANDTTEIKSAHKKMILAQREYKDIYELAKKGSESKQAYQRSKYAKQISELDFQAAKNKKSLASLDAAAEQVRVNAAHDSIKRNALESPVDGIVFEVFKDGGEWVTAGEKVMRIARMDRLRIQGFVEASKYDPHQVANRPVTVELDLARDSIEFTGQIVFVSLEKGGNRYRVWAEVDNIKRDNRWVLQAEGEVTMQIHLDQNASSMTQRNGGGTVPR